MKDMKEIISFLKDKGFIFSGSEIYGGLANSWDYGHLSVLVKDNIKKMWSDFFITKEINFDAFSFDSSIILNSLVWKASGHVDKFTDPVIICLNDNSIHRADHLIEEFLPDVNVEKLSLEEMKNIIDEKINLDKFGTKTKWGEIKDFNLMFKTTNSKIGMGEELYLRPETAQGVFINFKNVVNTYNPKIPFLIGQKGKAFRNEVTPGNFIFRTKEFEQLELEFFTHGNEADKWFDYYVSKVDEFLDKIGIKRENLRKYDVPKESLAHYSKRTIDIEFKFPFGWGELLGIANRTDHDLKKHMEESKENLEFHNQISNEKFIPYIIETSMGIERLFLAIISSSLINDGERDVLQLPYEIAPYKIAIAPLTNKLDEESKELYKKVVNLFDVPILFSKGGTIGKRYRKLDSIGVPFVITFDFDSLEDKMVTIRDRDTKNSVRIKIDDIKTYIEKNAKK